MEKFQEYLNNRKALGYKNAESYKGFFERKDVQEVQALFSLSRLDEEWISEVDNGLVFVEMGIPEPGKVGKIFYNPQ